MKRVLAIASFFGLLALAPATTAQSSAETPSGPAKPDGRVVQPAKRSLDAIPLEVLGPGVARQVVHGTQGTFARWQLKSGASVPLHHHVNEQMTWIISGRAEVFSGGERYDLQAGDVMVLPPNVEHAFTILEDTVAVDIFAPARQDWIDAAAAAAEQR
jgi:quercetin dioxygenase-like cupin family protein